MLDFTMYFDISVMLMSQRTSISSHHMKNIIKMKK